MRSLKELRQATTPKALVLPAETLTDEEIAELDAEFEKRTREKYKDFLDATQAKPVKVIELTPAEEEEEDASDWGEELEIAGDLLQEALRLCAKVEGTKNLPTDLNVAASSLQEDIESFIAEVWGKASTSDDDETPIGKGDWVCNTCGETWTYEQDITEGFKHVCPGGKA